MVEKSLQIVSSRASGWADGLVEYFRFIGSCLKEGFKHSKSVVDLCGTILGIGVPFFMWFIGSSSITPKMQDTLTNLFWKVPVCALAAVALARLIVSPFWVWKKMRDERDLLEKERDAALADKKAKKLTASVHEFFYLIDQQEMVARIVFRNGTDSKAAITKAYFSRRKGDMKGIESFIKDSSYESFYVNPKDMIVKEFRLSIPRDLVGQDMVFGIVFETANLPGMKWPTVIDALYTFGGISQTLGGTVSLDVMDYEEEFKMAEKKIDLARGLSKTFMPLSPTPGMEEPPQSPTS